MIEPMEGTESAEVEPAIYEEQKRFQRVMNAFRAYKLHVLNRINRCIQYIKSMSENHRRYLKEYSKHLQIETGLRSKQNFTFKVKLCVDINSEFLREMAEDANIFENQHLFNSQNAIDTELTPTPMDMDKVLSTLRQFAREWSADGEAERNQSFQPLLERAEKFFRTDRKNVKVLVPGAGLGRLAFEFASRGFNCQGNEFSFHMLSASCFILNRCKAANEYKIYPYVSHFSNNYRNEDQTRGVQVPDVHPGTLDADSNFSMAGGDFVEVYAKQKDEWDIVATCFFIDTAHNVVEYLEIIHGCLKPGGYWLNIGPLLYHFADMNNEHSIEPSFEDIKHIAQEIGFVILEEKTNIQSNYCNTPAAMLKYKYDSALLVCKKKVP